MHIPCCQDASTPTALERSILTLAGRRLYTKTPTFSCPPKPTSRLSWSRLLRLSGRTLVAGKGEPAFRRDQDSASASTSYHSPFQPCRRNLPDIHRRPPRATRGGFFFFLVLLCLCAHERSEIATPDEPCLGACAPVSKSSVSPISSSVEPAMLPSSTTLQGTERRERTGSHQSCS